MLQSPDCLPTRIFHFAWIVALVFCVLGAWAVGPHDFYIGGDGKWTEMLVRKYFQFTSPFDVNALNPLEGNFSQLFPMNAWLNPAIAQFLLLPEETARVTSNFTFLLILALAMYALARSLGMGRISAAVAAQCAAWFFPHFSFRSGIFTIYALNPTAALTVALYMLLLVVAISSSGRTSRYEYLAKAAMATALAGLIVYNDPMTMGVIGFCIAPAYLAAIVTGADGTRAVISRMGLLAIAGGILIAAGIAEYIYALDHYTHRYVFRTEFTRHQVPGYASMLFFLKSGTTTLAICAGGLIAGLLFARGPSRRAVWVGAFTLACSALAGAIYLFSGVLWWFPLPMYIEFYGLHFVMIGAAAGALGAAEAGLKRMRSLTIVAKVVPKLELRIRWIVPAGAVLLLVAMPAALYRGGSRMPPLTEPYMDQAFVESTFKKDLSIAPGAPWRGSVYSVFDIYRKQLTYYTLWRNDIPTLNEYSQTSTPLFRYMTRRIMHVAEPGLEPMAIAQSRRWEVPFAAALGVRYLMLHADESESVEASRGPEARAAASERILKAHELRQVDWLRLNRIATATATGYPSFTWAVYELNEPNVGQYSPTRVRLASEVAQYRRHFASPGFDWRRDVVLESDPGALREARGATIFVERGHLRIEAESAINGRSMLLLPVQFSHCLNVAGSGMPQLVRANMYFAGLIFEGRLDARIDYTFGFLNSKCRIKDLDDMTRMRIPETALPSSPAVAPFTIRLLDEIPDRWRKLVDIHSKLQ